MQREKSAALFKEAKTHFPGGVNSPVRAFGGVGGDPVFMHRGQGAYIWDEDDNRYIDYVGSWGPMILGHQHPGVMTAVQEALASGLSFGTPTRLESQLAALITAAMPALEKLRMVSSGTEACMSALRLARGFTGRNKILKFVGCYHGHADMLLVKAGSGVATFGIPGSPGVPPGATADTITAPFNDLTAVKQVIAEHGADLAAIIVEPFAGNCGFIKAQPGFLAGLRALCDESGALLIFDEVMTGFRVAFGGVQGLTGIKPDLTTLGKVIGGGMPVGAYGGRADIMAQVAPEGPVYQAGTLSGHPVCMASGIATLEALKKSDYQELGQRSSRLMAGLQQAAQARDLPMVVASEGGMFGFAFTADPLRDFATAAASDHNRFKAFFHHMLDHGVYLAPSGYEAGFVSFAHSDQDIAATVAAAADFSG